MESNLLELVNTINQVKLGNQFHKYIDFIRYPFYRNIEIDTQINFGFPLTVFIGQNGCGKSSCLHALYGAPEGFTPYQFWFDTKVDPIDYYDSQKKRHSFWYSFKDENNNTREVLKARIRRKDDPNYWETSRPLSWAGMKTRENINERDAPVSKNVVYLDFRAELSAFDKFFYFGNLRNSTARNKQEFLRRKSSSLKKLFTETRKSINSSKHALNEPIEFFTPEELRWISYILGRNYSNGISVLHELFRTKGYSVLFQTNFAKYSEAFAGSGEIAIVRLVKEVLSAEQYSLILLDEPEVSLHPGAQERLKLFLLEQIKIKKHQIIITSHSPSIIKGLPSEAIKVFYQNPNNGRFLVKENLTPEEAFYHIEFPIESRRNIIVEDVLAKEILSGVIEKIGVEAKNLFNIKFNPGGETVIKKEFISVFCRELNRNDYVFFDGDQKPKVPVFDWRSIPTSELNLTNLKLKIKEITREEIKFTVDGGRSGGNQEQQLELLKKYLDFYLHNVFYLPKLIPEDIIWNDDFVKDLLNAVTPNNGKVSAYLIKLNIINGTKNKFAFIAEIILGNSSSENISSLHKQFIRRWLNYKNEDFCEIKSAINSIINCD